MSLIRSIAERLARKRIVVRTLANGRRIAVSPDARLNYLRTDIEPELAQIARLHVRPGAKIWDIGANCGAFLFSCDHAERRIAVEPDPFLCELIERSSAMNGLAVTLYQKAIAASHGESEFVVAKRGRASNHLRQVSGSSQSGGAREIIRVATMTLDDILDEQGPPDFVKIDIEGAELLALQGAKRLLAHRPMLYIEVYEEQADACRAILHSAGYAISGTENWLATPR